MTKKDYTEWALSQMDKYGIRHPDTYSEKELKRLTPNVPHMFTKKHVEQRDKVTQ
jgi:hypothetical protein